MANSDLDSAELPPIPAGTQVTTLENGLTIIVREDHSAPVVSTQAWCMAGSVNEGKWLGAGLSHVLEHMLFKGTTTRPGSRIDQEVQEAGGYMNAYTSFDRTVYHVDVPNTGARVALDILCDIMQNATLPADELAKEQDVIRREMDMNVDDPGRRSSRRLFETAYTRSPYRFTVIGYPDVFNELRPDDIAAYYREKYAPNNVFFVVAGDITAHEAVEQIRKSYEKNKSRPIPPAVLPHEPRQTAPREIVEEAPVELGHIHIAWHIPELRHPDLPALDVLALLLGHGRSSRLYQQVRDKLGVAHHADAWTYSPGDPGLFGVSAIVDGDKFTSARDALLAEVEKVRTSLIPAEELVKAVKQFVSATLSARKTMQGQAQDLGSSWLAAGDLNFSERYLRAVRRVTPEDLLRVAREYLSPDNRTVYALLPTGAAPKTHATATTRNENAIVKFELVNGLRLLVKEDPRLPFVELRTVFCGGVLAETAKNNGVTQLTGKMLLKGTRHRSAEALANKIESVGGSIDSYGGNNSFGVNAEVLSGDFRTGLNLLCDVLLNPTFPAPALERERQVQFANIQAQRDHLLKSASVAMRRALFGNSGYGLDALGTEESLSALTSDDLANFHRLHAAPNNCVLAIFGDVKAAEMKAVIEERLGAWKANPALTFNLQPSTFNPSKRTEELRDKKQAVIVMGFPGTTVQSPDRYALELLQEACSDLGSRLFLRIREELALAYYVGAQHFPGLAPGYFAFYAGTMPEKIAQVEMEFLREAELLCADGLTDAELRRAKAKIIGQRKIARQDLGTLAMTSALDELYGLGYAHADTEDKFYEAVSGEQIREVARKYLKPDRSVVATVKPGETT